MGGGRRPPPQIIYPNHPPDGSHNSPADSPPDSRADSPRTAQRQPAQGPFNKTPCTLLTATLAPTSGFPPTLPSAGMTRPAGGGEGGGLCAVYCERLLASSAVRTLHSFRSKAPPTYTPGRLVPWGVPPGESPGGVPRGSPPGESPGEIPRGSPPGDSSRAVPRGSPPGGVPRGIPGDSPGDSPGDQTTWCI